MHFVDLMFGQNKMVLKIDHHYLNLLATCNKPSLYRFQNVAPFKCQNLWHVRVTGFDAYHFCFSSWLSPFLSSLFYGPWELIPVFFPNLIKNSNGLWCLPLPTWLDCQNSCGSVMARAILANFWWLMDTTFHLKPLTSIEVQQCSPNLKPIASLWLL